MGPVVASHGLRPIPMADLVGESHHYADLCFDYGATGRAPPAFVSTVKIKQAGFSQVYDTEESLPPLAAHADRAEDPATAPLRVPVVRAAT